MISTIEVWTKPNCVHCNRAKKLLEMNNLAYAEYKLDVHFTRERLLELYPAAKTYPVVIVDGWNIGGANELAVKLQEEYKNNTQLLNEG